MTTPTGAADTTTEERRGPVGGFGGSGGGGGGGGGAPTTKLAPAFALTPTGTAGAVLAVLGRDPVVPIVKNKSENSEDS